MYLSRYNIASKVHCNISDYDTIYLRTHVAPTVINLLYYEGTDCKKIKKQGKIPNLGQFRHFETRTSGILQKIQSKTNSENRHLVFSIFKKKQGNNGVGDISF